MNKNCFIEFRNVSLIYNLNYEGVNTLKGRFLNFIYQRKSPVNRPDILYALKNISIKINHGERVGIIGLNGSGKSTFLKVAAGILKPQKGEVKARGHVQPLIEIAAGFNPEFSGRENIYLNGAMLGFFPDRIREKEEEIINFSELIDFIDIPVKYYSTGMSVRLAFTIATMIQPEILLMDEMLSAGDLTFIEKAKKRIEKILNNAKILVLVSHDLALIGSLTNRCLVLEEGQILFDGGTEAAIEFYKNKTIYKIEKNFSENKRKTPKEIMDSQIDLEIKNLQIDTIDKRRFYEPNSKINFEVDFDLVEPFETIMLNLHVNDRLGVQQLHFRNDFQGLRFEKCEVGKYHFEIEIPEFPLKTGKYLVFCRAVGVIKYFSKIVDSQILELEIMEGKLRNTIINNSWKVQGPFELIEEI